MQIFCTLLRWAKRATATALDGLGYDLLGGTAADRRYPRSRGPPGSERSSIEFYEQKEGSDSACEFQ